MITKMIKLMLFMISALQMCAGTLVWNDDDFIISYMGKNVSTNKLLHRLNFTGKFSFNDLCPNEQHSCRARCFNTTEHDAERLSRRPCYCDRQCVEIGDCCYDYFSRCSHSQGSRLPKKSLRKCISLGDSGYGYFMRHKCPDDKYNSPLRDLCESIEDGDFLKNLPVQDKEDGTIYRNVFCAQCNSAYNISYWTMGAVCQSNLTSDITENKTLLMSFIENKCSTIYRQPDENQTSIQHCLAKDKHCTWKQSITTEPLLAGLCSFYTFPMCGRDSMQKNPHCMLCNRWDITRTSCECAESSGSTESATSKPVAPSPPPPLNILFDFSSSVNKIHVGKRTTVLHPKSCKRGYIYDPFLGTCRKTFRKPLHKDNSLKNETTVDSSRHELVNCSLIRLKLSETTLFANSTLWVPLYGASYNRSQYFINNTYVFLCTSYVKNYTEKETRWFYKLTALHILTYVGCSVSVLSLVILSMVYLSLKELRTLPGKCLINLACSLTLYHVCLFAAGERNITELCIAIAACLHYFVLCSFAWMGIMAFDTTKTFVFRGSAPISRNTSNSNKMLLKYCLYGWGLPALLVSTCIVLDVTSAVNIGYGTGGFCWIGNGKILFFLVGVPVAFVLLFNSTALTWTMVSIYKVKKQTHQLADQRSHPSLALLCVKLTSVLGLTWVLGFVSSIANTDVTTYLFVTVNSLQGFFISVAFIANKRTLTLLRSSRKKQRQVRRHDNTTFTTKL